MDGNKSLSCGAERNRRYRQRQKLGVRVVPVPVDHCVVQVLIACGLLAESQEGDTGAVAEAIVKSAQKIRDASR